MLQFKKHEAWPSYRDPNIDCRQEPPLNRKKIWAQGVEAILESVTTATTRWAEGLWSSIASISAA